MKVLYLLRHAKSDWDNPNLDDFDRPLNARGIKASKRLGSMFKAEKIRPDHVFCSPARRTRQTLDLLSKAGGVKCPVTFEERLYAADTGQLLDVISRASDHDESVMIVAHNPGIEMLAQILADPSSEQQGHRAMQKLMLKYPTGGFATLELDIDRWRDIEEGRGRLVSFIVPRELQDQ